MRMSPKLAAVSLTAMLTMPLFAPHAHGQPRKPHRLAPNATCTFYTHSRLRMADSTPFRRNGLSCASWDLPLHSVVEITSRGGRRFRLVVRDRGPAYDIPVGTFRRLFGAQGVRRGRVRARVRVVRRGGR